MLELVKEKTKAMLWGTWHEAKAKFGEKEALARLHAKTLPTRRSPTDPRFWEFLIVTDSTQLTTSQRQQFQVLSKQKLSAQEFMGLTGALGLPLEDLQAAWEAPDASGDEPEACDTANDAAPSAAKPKPQAKTKADPKTAFEQKVDACSANDNPSSTSIQAAVNKCAKMHSFSLKALQEAKNKLRGQPCPEKQAAVDALAASAEELDEVVVSGGETCTVAAIKKLLLRAAKQVKGLASEDKA
jgi:hypothetical protein